jgi:hypothetical protein
MICFSAVPAGVGHGGFFCIEQILILMGHGGLGNGREIEQNCEG